ncbi:MAG: 4'-phosphopantetheinyl transferase superfamily protein [Verrucomicrobiota bacterium]
MPIPANHTHLWFIPHDLVFPGIPPLSEAELDRANRFLTPKDQKRYLTTQTALRQILAQYLHTDPTTLAFETNPFGKPSLAPPHQHLHFNLSHAHDLSLLALATHPLGIDLEPSSRDLTDLASSILHPNEQANSLNLLKLWTAKEAYLKALGQGLQIDPKNVFIDLEANTASTPNYPTLSIQQIPHPTHTIHLSPAATTIKTQTYQP